MQDEYDAYVSEHFRRGAMRQLSDDERHALIDGLKVYTRFARVPDESLGSFFWNFQGPGKSWKMTQMKKR